MAMSRVWCEGFCITHGGNNAVVTWSAMPHMCCGGLCNIRPCLSIAGTHPPYAPHCPSAFLSTSNPHLYTNQRTLQTCWSYILTLQTNPNAGPRSSGRVPYPSPPASCQPTAAWWQRGPPAWRQRWCQPRAAARRCRWGTLGWASRGTASGGPCSLLYCLPLVSTGD